MKTVTIVDLRHYERVKGDEQQRPTDYGRLSAIAAALLLRKRGLVPQYWITSPQPRAIETGLIIQHTLDIHLTPFVLRSIDDLSSDSAFDSRRLYREAQGQDVSPEFIALTADWSRQYVFDRSCRAFDEIGGWTERLVIEPEPIVLMTGHGAAIEMRCLRMMALDEELIQLPDQLVGNLRLTPDGLDDTLGGELFDTCEGAVYWNLDETDGRITFCGSVELLRLPTEVKALKRVFA